MSPDFDRLRAGLARFVEQVMARVDLFASYPCTVVSQNADGTLELKPDVPRFGLGISKVPIRLGLPGVTVKVKPQSRVMLSFENGSVQAPIATLWEAQGLDEIILTALTKVTVISPLVVLGDDENAQPVARLGDTMECVFPPLVPVSGTLSGAPFAGVLTIADRAVGIITTAGLKVKAA